MSSRIQPRPRRGALLPTIVVVAVLGLLLVLFSGLWTSKMWFQSIDYSTVFNTMLWTRVGLFFGFGALMALGVVGSTALAYRLRPTVRPQSGSELLDRYREGLESRFVPVMVIVGILTGLFAGVSATGQAQTFLAWRHGTPFGQADPRFGHDIAFFVFDLPWLRFVLGFLVSLFTFAAIAAAIVHWVMGGIQLARIGQQRTPRKSSRAAQTQVSILVGLIVLGYAANVWLSRYSTEVTSNPLLTGLVYTDDNARIPASTAMTAIAVLCALLFFAQAVLRRWLIAVAAVVLMLVSGVVLSLIYPAIIQGVVVRPNEPDKERSYIEQHIQATRAAYDVNDVEITDYSATTETTPGQLRADAEALPGIRLMDPSVIGPTYDQLQQVRGYYTFPKVLDVDRYHVDGKETDAVVAVRELDVSGLQDQSWNNLRTVYTHGYGLVAAYGNRSAGGEPDWLSQDLPPEGTLKAQESRIYFGEQHSTYSVVGAPPGAAPLELDTPGGGQGGGPQLNTYRGKGGVDIGNWFHRVLYAIKFGDINILLSNRVNEDSKIIYDRTPRERVEKVAPWLTLDNDVYPAIVEGRIVWIVDGYTTSNSYPNSHRMSLQQTTSDAQTNALNPGKDVNYMRNSVKAVVDAYDGSVQMYAWDEKDPVLQTWRKAMPDTVKDRSEIPADLLNHLRYPEDMFKAQREVLGRYHVQDPAAWFQANDLWQIPNDPVNKTATAEAPYYLSIKWPGDEDPVFSQTSTFTPRGRENLASYMAVNADASSPDYGRLRILRMSDSTQIDGPSQAFNAMQTNETVRERLRSYTQGSSAPGANVINGNLLTLPMGGGLLYANPVYAKREAGNGAYPVLAFVVVRFGQNIGIGNTLQEALDQLFEGDAGASTGETEGRGPNSTPPQPQGPADQAAAMQKVAEAQAAFAEADKALAAGDLGTYQKKNAEAKAAVAAAKSALGG